MSYLVCGLILFADASLERKKAVARFASIRALQGDMAVQLGHNIVQPLVFEIVESIHESTLPFLLLDSPLSDTSDELVSPYVLVGDDGEKKFRQNAKSMAVFFNSLLYEKDVLRVELYVVDSFDTSIPTKSIQASSLEQELLTAWSHRDEEFFFRLILRKLAATT